MSFFKIVNSRAEIAVWMASTARHKRRNNKYSQDRRDDWVAAARQHCLGLGPASLTTFPYMAQENTSIEYKLYVGPYAPQLKHLNFLLLSLQFSKRVVILMKQKIKTENQIHDLGVISGIHKVYHPIM